MHGDISQEARQASADLITATRELMVAASLTDVEASELRAAQQVLVEVTRLLTKETRPRAFRAPFGAPGAARDAGADATFPLAAHNPLSVPLDVRFAGDTACAEFTANAMCEGPPDSVHGGLSAWLMDVMLGILIQAHGRRAVTATLDVRYLRRTPLDAPLQLHSRITARSGRKTYAEGWIEHEGERTVEATGLFIDVLTAR